MDEVEKATLLEKIKDKARKSKGFKRLRVGDYRIIYQIENDKLIVRVVDAGNRGQIYNYY